MKQQIDFGTPIKLASREELAKELVDRFDLPCIVIYQTKDDMLHMFDNLDEKLVVSDCLREAAECYDAFN